MHVGQTFTSDIDASRRSFLSTTILCVFLFVIVPRLLILPISAIGPDEGIYALVGRDLLHGKLPYDGAFDHKPIALYYLFAAFQAAFGETIASIRLLGMFVVSATAMLIAGIARRSFGADTASTCALIATYGMWSMANDGSSTNTEIVLNFWLSAALYVTLSRNLEKDIKVTPAFISGFLLALAFQTNYLSGFLVLGYCSIYGMLVFNEHRLAFAFRLFVINGVVIFIGFLAGLTVTLLPIALFGNLKRYFDLQISFLQEYPHTDPTLLELVKRIVKSLSQYYPLIALPVVLLIGYITRNVSRSRLKIVHVFGLGFLAYALWGLCATLVSQNLFTHYFVMLLLPLTFLAGLSLMVFPVGYARNLASGWLIAMGVLSNTLGSPGGVLLSGTRAYASILRGEPADGLASIANHALRDLGPRDLVYVYDGGEPLLYLMIGRSAPTPYPMPHHHLMPSLARALGIEPESEMAKILKTEPKVIIVEGDLYDERFGAASRLLADEISRNYSKLDEEWFQDRKYTAFSRSRTKPVILREVR